MSIGIGIGCILCNTGNNAGPYIGNARERNTRGTLRHSRTLRPCAGYTPVRKIDNNWRTISGPGEFFREFPLFHLWYGRPAKTRRQCAGGSATFLRKIAQHCEPPTIFRRPRVYEWPGTNPVNTIPSLSSATLPLSSGITIIQYIIIIYNTI